MHKSNIYPYQGINPESKITVCKFISLQKKNLLTYIESKNSLAWGVWNLLDSQHLCNKTININDFSTKLVRDIVVRHDLHII